MRTFNNLGELEAETQTLDKLVLAGQKGGGGNQAAPGERDDTIFSKQTIRLLLVLSEGQIYNLDRTDVYLGDVSLDSYKNVLLAVRAGLPNQDVIPGFETIENPHPSNNSIELLHGTDYIKNVSTSSVSALRVILTFASLMKQDAEGNLTGAKVEHRIFLRPSESAAWGPYKAVIREEKSKGGFSIEIRISRPGSYVPNSGDRWGIKIIRVTQDDPDSKSNTKCSWSSTIELQTPSVPLPYPNTALVGLVLKNAIKLGGTIPAITIRAKGIMVKVPEESFYNAATRTYLNLAWNGNFSLAKQYSPCTAWILYDILTRTEAQGGLGIPESEINRYSFFELAYRCDEQIAIRNHVGTPTGQYEPRHSFHNWFASREPAGNILTYILASCNSVFSTDEFGNLTVIPDAPKTSSELFTNSDVINGVFEYFSNDLDDRVTSVNVTYNNPKDLGRTATVTVPDSAPTAEETALVARYGHNSSDIVLIGCMSESEAARKGRWVLYTNSVTTGFVSFQTFMRGLTVKVGKVIEILDNENQNVTQQGLVKAVVNTTGIVTITLDRQIEFGTEDYHLTYWSASGLQNIAVSNRNLTTDIVRLTPGNWAFPLVGSSWALAGNIKPTKWRVSSLETDAETHIHTITCTQYAEEKYAYVDGGGFVLPDIYPYTGNLEVPPVTNVRAYEHFYDFPTEKYSSLIVEWDWADPSNPTYAAQYQVFWRKDGDTLTEIKNIPRKFLEIPWIYPGIYEIIIFAESYLALKSDPVSFVYNYKTGAPNSSTLLPPGHLYAYGRTDQVFEGRDAILTWEYNPLNTNVTDRLFDYMVEIWTEDGLTLKNTFFVTPDSSLNGAFTYSFTQNDTDFGDPVREFVAKVYSRDYGNKLSTAIAATFTNPAPAAISATVYIGIETAYMDIIASSEKDIAGYVAHMSTVSGFTPDETNLIYDGVANLISKAVAEGATYYFRFAAYDAFGKTGLNYSSQYSGTALGLNVVTWTFTGVVFKANDPVTDKVSWTAGTASNDKGDSYAISAGNFTWTSGILYLYYKTGETTLRSTTTLGVAIADGVRILGTYEGGTKLILGNGDAFISGDKLLAGTVGANALITNSAIITNVAQMGTGIMDYANITGTLQANKVLVSQYDTLANIFTDVSGFARIDGGKLVVSSVPANALGNGSYGDFSNTNGVFTLADGTVGNSKVTSIDGGKITTGYLAADRIQTNTLTVRKLIGGEVVHHHGANSAGVLVGTSSYNPILYESFSTGRDNLTRIWFSVSVTCQVPLTLKKFGVYIATASWDGAALAQEEVFDGIGLEGRFISLTVSGTGILLPGGAIYVGVKAEQASGSYTYYPKIRLLEGYA